MLGKIGFQRDDYVSQTVALHRTPLTLEVMAHPYIQAPAHTQLTLLFVAMDMTTITTV